jgi:hypothetical protein
MITRQQRQKQAQGPYSDLDIANHPARLADFVWAIQDLAIAQQDVNPAAQERLYKHLCNINSHRIMITHTMQVRNMQINRRRKLVYNLKRLIEQKSTVASAYSSSGNYPEKACHMEMLQMHLGFIEEIKTVAVSSIYPIINYIADVVAAARAEFTTLHDTAHTAPTTPTTTPTGLSCSGLSCY